MTTELMDWLNQNRYRSYPMVRDEWRKKVSPESGLDRVLLDVQVFDSDSAERRKLVLNSISISRESASVVMEYGGKPFECLIPEGTQGGEGSYVRRCGAVPGSGRNATVSMAFSSHAHLAGFLADGTWEIGCEVLPSRVVSLSDGYGVDFVLTNGSKGVDGHEMPACANGDVVLEDGFRTSPIIFDGNVLVRVGRRYGYDPCVYEYEDDSMPDCRKPLFFFCGQNAVSGGNVVLSGGAGVSVMQGRKYTVRDANSKCNGKTIPCVEIVAGKELMDLYKPGRPQNSAVPRSAKVV